MAASKAWNTINAPRSREAIAGSCEIRQEPVGAATAVILCILLLTGCGQTSSPDDFRSVQSRITAVENGVLPQHDKSGTTPAGMPISNRMAHYFTPGVSIAVVNNGRIEWAKGYGLATAGSMIAVTADHLFQACSFSKPVAAIGVSGFDAYTTGQPVPTLLQVLNGAAPANNPRVSVEAVPGSAYSYSGGGMEILHQLVDEVTGALFADFMRDRLLSK